MRGQEQVQLVGVHPHHDLLASLYSNNKHFPMLTHDKVTSFGLVLTVSYRCSWSDVFTSIMKHAYWLYC